MLSKLTIQSRLALNIALSVAGFAIITAFALFEIDARLQASSQDKVKEIVRVANSTVTSILAKKDEEGVERADGEASALEVLRGFRYGDSDYVFVIDNDLLMVMHPFKPELEGQSVGAIVDSDGVALFQEMREAAHDGGGFVAYHWPRAGSDTPVPKISYVEIIPGTNWIVGTGVYVDDLDETFFRASLIMLGLASVVMLLMGFGVWWVGRSISRPLGVIRTAVQRLADDDLDVRLPYRDERNELGEIACAVEDLKAGLVRRRHLAHEREHDQEVQRRRTGKLRELADGFYRRIGEQIATVTEIADATRDSANELTGTAHATLGETDQVEQSAGVTSQSAQALAAACDQLGAAIREISAQVQRQSAKSAEVSTLTSHSREQVAGLSEKASAISEVVNLITSIAEQTNLLALNATIEAARAGDAGRGFAVVASEVKNLATQTSNATSDIAEKIAAVQRETATTVSAIEAMAGEITGISEIAAGIAAAVEQQEMATNGITHNVQQVADSAVSVSDSIKSVAGMAGKTESMAEGLSRPADSLAERARDLDKLVKTFIEDVQSA